MIHAPKYRLCRSAFFLYSGIWGKTLRTYVHSTVEEKSSPVLRYVRMLRNVGKPIYIGSGNRFNPEEAPDPPSGSVGDFVAVFKIVLALVRNHTLTETAAL